MSFAPYWSAALAESLFHCCARVVGLMRAFVISPADHLLAVLVDDRFHPLDEARVLLGRKCLHFVTAHMEVGTGCERGNLADDVVHERVGLFLVDAESAPANVDSGIVQGIGYCTPAPDMP
jgi:hypothetical protein